MVRRTRLCQRCHRQLALYRKVCPCALSRVMSLISAPSLAAALSQDVRKKFGITHILSVCAEHTFEPKPDWLSVVVQDSEYEDILIHFPQTCAFIQAALENGGRVLVHCMMGISRSAAVVSAYREYYCHFQGAWLGTKVTSVFSLVAMCGSGYFQL